MKLLLLTCIAASIGISANVHAQEKNIPAKSKSAMEVRRILQQQLKPLGLGNAKQTTPTQNSKKLRLTNQVDELTRKLALKQTLEKVSPIASSLPIAGQPLGALLSRLTQKKPTTPPVPPVTGNPSQGIFSNHPMGNVPYRSFSANGVTSFQGTTDASGNYRFNTGDTVVLTVAGVDIAVPAGERINPSYIIDTLFPTPTFSEEQRQNAIINLSTFLQSMDSDDNLNNGIGVKTNASVQGINSPLNKSQFADQTPETFSKTLEEANQANNSIKNNNMPLKPVDSLLALANYFRNELSGSWVGNNPTSPSLLTFDSLCPLYPSRTFRVDLSEPCFSNTISFDFSFNQGAGPIVSGPYSVYVVNVGIQARVTPASNGTVASNPENNGARKFVTAVYEESILDSAGMPTGKTRFDIVGFYLLTQGSFAADTKQGGLDPAGLITLNGTNLNLTWDYRYQGFDPANPTPSTQVLDSETFSRQEGTKNTLLGTWALARETFIDPENNCSRPQISQDEFSDVAFTAPYFDCETGAMGFSIRGANQIFKFGANNKYFLVNSSPSVTYGDYVINGNSITITSVLADTSAFGSKNTSVGEVINFGAPVNNDVTRFVSRTGFEGIVFNRILSLKERTNQFKPTAINNTPR